MSFVSQQTNTIDKSRKFWNERIRVRLSISKIILIKLGNHPKCNASVCDDVLLFFFCQKKRRKRENTKQRIPQNDHLKLRSHVFCSFVCSASHIYSGDYVSLLGSNAKLAAIKRVPFETVNFQTCNSIKSAAEDNNIVNVYGMTISVDYPIGPSVCFPMTLFFESIANAQ